MAPLLLVALMSALSMLTGCQGCSNNGGNEGMVRYAAHGSKVRTLDPMNISDTTSAAVGSNIYDTLYQYHYLKEAELVPSLAAEMPEVSEDQMTYTIKLREDVYFQDDESFPDGEGRNLTAQDFVYSWKRLANVHNASSNWAFLQDKIKGLDAFREYTDSVSEDEVDYDRTVEGLQTPDKYTLEIHLTQPWPQLRYVLAHLPTAAVPREAVEHYGDEFLNNPVGTGAYQLETWNRGSRIVLVRNPDYRDERYPSEGSDEAREQGLLEDAGEKLPFLDRIEISIIQEDQPYWLTFMNGEIDAAGIPKDNFNQVITGSQNRTLTEDLRERGVELLTIRNPDTFWIAVNMEDPVLGDNRPLRRALSVAIDRDDYIDLFSNGRGVPARGIFPPVFGVHNPDLNSPHTTHDRQKARQLVQEARRAHGGPLPQLVLSLGGTDTSTRQRGQYLKRAWEEVGLNVRVDMQDWPTLQQRVDNKSVQMFQYGWIADYPDAANFLMLFYSKNTAPGPNSFNYQNSEFDQVFEQAKTMPPGPERAGLYRQAEQMVVDDLPALFMMHSEGYALKHPWLKNYHLHAWASGTYKYQKIDLELRRERTGR